MYRFQYTHFLMSGKLEKFLTGNSGSTTKTAAHADLLQVWEGSLDHPQRKKFRDFRPVCSCYLTANFFARILEYIG